jgi:hypothetical protein
VIKPDSRVDWEDGKVGVGFVLQHGRGDLGERNSALDCHQIDGVRAWRGGGLSPAKTADDRISLEPVKEEA